MKWRVEIVGDEALACVAIPHYENLGKMTAEQIRYMRQANALIQFYESYYSDPK